MITKIKDSLEFVKQALMYVVAPLAFIVGYTLYLIRKNRGLEQKLEESKTEGDLIHVEDEKIDLDTSANDAVDEFERLRGALRDQNNVSGSSGSGGEGNSGSKSDH